MKIQHSGPSIGLLNTLYARLDLANQPFKSATNSTTALQVQQSDATVVLNVDTTNKAFQITGSSSLIADASTSIPLLVKGAASQSANLTEWQDSGGNVLIAIQADGDVFTDRWLEQTTNTFIGNGVAGGGNLAHGGGVEGYYNSGFGSLALRSITTGAANVAFGHASLYNITSGNLNMALGGNSLRYNTTGGSNAGIGVDSLHYNVTGNNNVAIGYQAGYGVSTNSHSNNTLIGYQAGYGLTTGSSNIFLGYTAGDKQTTLSNLLIVDNQTRADVATELTNSILYGVMAAAPANQTLRINAVTTVTDKLAFTQTDGNEYIDSLADGYMDYYATTAHRFNNPLTVANIKSGATQGGAGAAASEIWKTASHATLPDNVLMIGV